MQEGACLCPVALDGSPGDAHRLGDLLLGEPAEEAVLDHTCEARIKCGESGQRLIELQQRIRLIVSADVLLVETDVVLVAPSLQPPASLRSIDQDMPHRQRRDGEEVRTVTPLRLRLVDEFDVRLVDERGRRERAAASTYSKLSMGDGAQLRVHDGHKSVERFGGAAPQFPEDGRACRSVIHIRQTARCESAWKPRCRILARRVVLPGDARDGSEAPNNMGGVSAEGNTMKHTSVCRAARVAVIVAAHFEV